MLYVSFKYLRHVRIMIKRFPRILFLDETGAEKLGIVVLVTMRRLVNLEHYDGGKLWGVSVMHLLDFTDILRPPRVAFVGKRSDRRGPHPLGFVKYSPSSPARPPRHLGRFCPPLVSQLCYSDV